VTENLGWKWALIGVLLAATGWLLLTPKADGSGPISLGIDISGGTSLTYTVSRREIDALPPNEQSKALADTIDAISRRIDTLGTKEITVRQVGRDQIQIDAPRMGEAEALKIREQMLQLGNLEFLIVLEDDEAKTSTSRSQWRLGDQNLALAYDADGIGTEFFDFSVAQAEAQRKEAYEKKVDLRGERYVDGQRYTLLRSVPTKTADGKTVDTWVEAPVVWMPHRPRPDRAGGVEAAAELKKSLQGLDGVDHEKIKGAWLFRDPRYFGQGKDGFTGKSIKEVRRTSDKFGGRAVSFAVDTYKQSDFKTYTGDNLNRLLAICLNDEVWTAPSINAALSESVEIYNSGGGFSQEDQDWLVNCLTSGSLRLKPREASRETIGPSLGELAIKRGIWASVVAFGLTIVFMLWYYKFGGLVANIALLLNVAFTLGVVVLFDATLTLPGIAGLILTIGMAVDANILVFERTREEAAKGKKLLESLAAGYDRAFITILDANLTTALTAAMLIWHGTGPIKGFGVTLLAGIIVSMFTSLFITKAIFGFAISKGMLTELRFEEAIKPVRYPFLAKSGGWIKLSWAMCALCVIVFFASGRAKYGLDFTGGTMIDVRFSQALSAADVRAKVEAIKTPDGKPKYEEIEVAKRDPIPGVPPAVAEYDVRLRSTTEVDAPEVKAYFAEKTATIFGGPEGGGAPASIGDPSATNIPGEWTIEFTFAAKRDEGDVRKRLDLYRDSYGNAPFAGAIIRSLDGEMTDSTVMASKYAIDVSRQDVARGNAAEDLRAAFGPMLDPIPFGRINFIGPNVVVTLKESAIVSMILSIIAIIFYTWFRFKEVKYGLAASLALVHDVVVPLGVAITLNWLGILEVPITLQSIAAYLTIIGFSINDTIVIFDRVRENLATTKGSFREIMDLSLGQTLSRTVLTSATVFVVVLVLFGFNIGQDSPLEGFAFTMLLGVISGTYSTIFIACPFAAWLHDRDERRRAAAGTVLPARA
jgi:SecD/SecF fusion protein